MRRLASVGTSLSAVGDGDTPHSGDKATGGRDEDARRQQDDREEKAAHIDDADEEFFASGHFQADDGAWAGFETAYNVHLQLAPGPQSVSCPICLRVTQVPVHQDCGHVLCFYCMQQSFAALGIVRCVKPSRFLKLGRAICQVQWGGDANDELLVRWSEARPPCSYRSVARHSSQQLLLWQCFDVWSE
ncbi:putative atp-dependent protease [Phytophthora cinnamomi]|uniref:putative atp-dependent protease n=1 Tax=Phytophthora cinnamomi TaxID=4785 RepID=UPI00355ABE11|nr:putative atp-dependent protease [Phytophthora cinnamomi]